MTDYRKWDKFADDISSDDSEGENKPQGKPTVRVLGDNDVVQLGGDVEGGYRVTAKEEAEEPKLPRPPSPSNTKHMNIPKSATLAIGDISELTKNGSGCSSYYWRQDAGEVILTIPLKITHPDGKIIKGKDLCVSVRSAGHEGRKRTLSVGIDGGLPLTAHVPSTLILERTLRYDVNLQHPYSMKEEERSVADNKISSGIHSGTGSTTTVDAADWEIKSIPAPTALIADGCSTTTTTTTNDSDRSKSDNESGSNSSNSSSSSSSSNSSNSSSSSATCRVLEITFRKYSPIPGAVFWWDRMFSESEEIADGCAAVDVTKIADRRGSSKAPSASASGCSSDSTTTTTTNPEAPPSSSSSFAEVYAQAHQMFLEKIRAQKEQMQQQQQLQATRDVDEEDDG